MYKQKYIIEDVVVLIENKINIKIINKYVAFHKQIWYSAVAGKMPDRKGGKKPQHNHSLCRRSTRPRHIRRIAFSPERFHHMNAIL